MKNKIKISLCIPVVSLFLGLSTAYGAVEGVPAAEKPDAQMRSPLGCRDVGYRYEMGVLKILPEDAGERNSLYFVFNKLNKPLNLYQMLKNESTRSMYLNHTVGAKQWAVLSTNETQLKYICTIDDAKRPYGKIVDCAPSIKVCEYANVKYGLNNRGNLWLVSSTTRDSAVQSVLHYGIIPK